MYMNHSVFASTPFCVLVGVNQKRYYIHRTVLINASPYFDKLLQFPGIEADKNTVSLSEPVDTENAFEMFVEYCYHKDYKPSKEYSLILTHVEVYTFAERVCMSSLKKAALIKLYQELWSSYTRAAASGFSSSRMAKKGAKNAKQIVTTPATTTMSVENIVEMVETTYSYTPSPDYGAVAGIRDPLRALVTRFCASCLSQLRTAPEFMGLVRDYADFEHDLFGELKNGNILKTGEPVWRDMRE
ncbi:hypothetical protein K440DRAFT_664117 [Wilcoxina mikolae CBS 423.85]|nr:hypothetical protein K440DRAFT_664117 [Wilcoxina mikolae CBS 423.85]